MATTEQIARAKARVALARLSGKKLPDEVIERAALNYADAQDESKPERSPKPHLFHGEEAPTVTAVSTTVRPADDGSNDDIVEAEVVDLDEMPPPGDPRRVEWLHERLGLNELPGIGTILDVTRRFKKPAPLRKTSFVGDALFSPEPHLPDGQKWTVAWHKASDTNIKPSDEVAKVVYIVMDGETVPSILRSDEDLTAE